ncbi:MAG: FecR domain-containing protein [Arcobacter butzleri]|nr:FecR domain-containing protein [Aliarcobacter butzleri]
MRRLAFMLTLFSTLLFANVGTISLVEGQVTIQRDGSSFATFVGDKVLQNDLISTEHNSKAKVTFIDNTIITIGKESTLNIDEYIFDTNNPNNTSTEYSITKGAFHAITGQIGKVNPSKFKLKTKTASIGIRGTEIWGDQGSIFCTSGEIIVQSQGITQTVPQGHFVGTFPAQAPTAPTPIGEGDLEGIDAQLNTNNPMSNTGAQGFGDRSGLLMLDPTDGNPDDLGDDGATQGEGGETPPTTLAAGDGIGSWGDWANEIQDGHNDMGKIDDIATNDNYDTQTYVATIQDLVDQDKTLTFIGTITPNIDVGTYTSDIKFTFYFSDYSFNGKYNFNSDIFNAYGTFDGYINHHGFESIRVDDGAPQTITNGQFYGGNEVSNVRGDITMHQAVPVGSTIDTLKGTFKADKTDL